MPSTQSPIDIMRADVVAAEHPSRLEVRYPQRVEPVEMRWSVVDGDDTPEGPFVVPQLVVTPRTSEAHVVLGARRFDLQSFHWHSPSEHLIDGDSFPLELHLVHSSPDGELLVVGVLSEEGPADRSISPVFTRIESLDRPGSTTRSSMRLDILMPPDPSMYRYDGSLTTAPFTEGVRWFVCAETRTASQVQIDAHRSLVTAPRSEYGDRPRLDGNARSVQDLANRLITLA